jgi:hypothetical protein
MLEVYNDAANRIEADSAAEAEFQKALFKRVLVHHAAARAPE